MISRTWKFFKVQFCCLWKIYSCLLTPNCTRNRVITYTSTNRMIITKASQDRKGHKEPMRAQTGYHEVIVFSFASNWRRKWRQFSKPIIELRDITPMLLRITSDSLSENWAIAPISEENLHLQRKPSLNMIHPYIENACPKRRQKCSIYVRKVMTTNSPSLK